MVTFNSLTDYIELKFQYTFKQQFVQFVSCNCKTSEMLIKKIFLLYKTTKNIEIIIKYNTY